MSPAAPRVSAVICTRRRPDLLLRAVESLVSQTSPPDEIIVVENDAADDIVPRALSTSFPSVTYVSEPVPGLDFARNRALRESHDDIVAYLDDDAVADPGWVAAIRAVFSDPSVAACTGRVDPLSLDMPGQRLFEANGGFARGSEVIALPRDASKPLHGRRAPLIAWSVSVGSGCSLAVNRKAALAIGGFDEALDMGPALPGGGDHDMLWRLLLAGHTVVYHPAVRARHEHRASEREAIEQIVGHQRALVALLTKHAFQTTSRLSPSVTAFLAWRLFKPGVRVAKRLVGQDPLPASALLRMWGQCWRGLFAYPKARRLAGLRRSAGTT